MPFLKKLILLRPSGGSKPPALKAILHYALGLRFGKFVSKTRAKREQNATDSRFCPRHSVIEKHFLALGSRFGFLSRFSCILDTNMYLKRKEKREVK